MANPKFRRVSLGEFVDALEKNGYKQTTGTLVRRIGSKITACALGQAYLNLGMNTEKLIDNGSLGLAEYNQKNLPGFYEGSIYRLNDDQRMTIPQIVDVIKAEYKDRFGKNWRLRKINIPEGWWTE